MSNKRTKLADTVLNTKSTAQLDEEVQQVLDANIPDPPGGLSFAEETKEDEDTKEPELATSAQHD